MKLNPETKAGCIFLFFSILAMCDNINNKSHSPTFIAFIGILLLFPGIVFLLAGLFTNEDMEYDFTITTFKKNILKNEVCCNPTNGEYNYSVTPGNLNKKTQMKKKSSTMFSIMKTMIYVGGIILIFKIMVLLIKHVPLIIEYYINNLKQ